jgi:hypothetical protein
MRGGFLKEDKGVLLGRLPTGRNRKSKSFTLIVKYLSEINIHQYFQGKAISLNREKNSIGSLKR